MEKLINKILDNYYKKQIIQKIKNLMWFYDKKLDYKFTEFKEVFQLKIKKKEYNDELYTIIASLDNTRCLSYLIDWENLSKKIEKAIEKYEKIKY